MKKEYKYIIIGAGIAGCSVSYFLSKYSDDILLIEKNNEVASEASGAAGAFLSPLLGKPNEFKDLVTKSLKFSSDLYEKECEEFYNKCGVERIPKDDIDAQKFESYKPYMDFEYEQKELGYFFEIGAVVDSKNICKSLSKNVQKLLSYDVKEIKYLDNKWHINNDYFCENLILTTGHDISLLDEEYLNIRAVWGTRIDVSSSNCITHNYHKSCSLSVSKINEKNIKENFFSIGATHHRFEDKNDVKILSKSIENIDKKYVDGKYLKGINTEVDELVEKANDITTLENIKILNAYLGARASSVDYFPLVGEVVDNKQTLSKYPYIKNGSKVPLENYLTHKNLYTLNGVGGRGFVLSPYLAFNLVECIINDVQLDSNIITHRMFLRWARRKN